MAQSLEVNIKATSDVPQVVSRANDAISSLERRASSVRAAPVGAEVARTTAQSTSIVDSQFSKIGKSFGNTISSVFLSFAGPLAIISGVMAFIGNKIAEAKQLAQEGLNKIAEGETQLATDDEKKMANFFKLKEAREKEEKQVEAGREEMTRKFLTETEEGKKLQREAVAEGRAGFGTGTGDLSKSAEMQKIALDAFLNSPEGKKFAPIFKGEGGKTGATSFKGPEGFGNVVGVGANPVMEAMTMQLEESRKQTVLLESLNNKQPGGGVPVDFTKTAIPARASMLQGGN
jgi:hypothetical protein